MEKNYTTTAVLQTMEMSLAKSIDKVPYYPEVWFFFLLTSYVLPAIEVHNHVSELAKSDEQIQERRNITPQLKCFEQSYRTPVWWWFILACQNHMPIVRRRPRALSIIFCSSCGWINICYIQDPYTICYTQGCNSSIELKQN